MNPKKSTFLSLILKQRFEAEVSGWMSALQQGFDVAIVCPTEELQTMLSSYLQAANKSQDCRILTYCASPSSVELKWSTLEVSQNPIRTIYVCERSAPKGTGAVVFELQNIPALLPSPAFMITKLLEMAGLDGYVDSFDGRRMSQLKRVLEKNGLDDFFDAVVQVAYLVGFRADERAADDYLEKILSKPFAQETASQNNLDKDQISLEKLFERLIELPEPHDTLKAALAYYVFVRRRVSQTEASRILKVSRSTLQAHLQMAERLKVAHYFNAGTSHA